MKSNEIKHQLRGLIYLDNLNLESKLLGSDPVGLMNDHVFLDLSQCRFAELGALTKLLLIVERYLKNQHTIYLALPSIKYTRAEHQSEQFNNNSTLKEQILKRRQQTNKFLKKSGFVSAIQDIAAKY